MNHIRHSSTGKSSPSKNGRHGRHEPFTDQESARYALGVAASREPVPADVASRMSPEWAEACLLAVDDGEQGIDHWLKVTRARLRSDPARYEAIASALGLVWERGWCWLTGFAASRWPCGWSALHSQTRSRPRNQARWPPSLAPSAPWPHADP